MAAVRLELKPLLCRARSPLRVRHQCVAGRSEHSLINGRGRRRTAEHAGPYHLCACTPYSCCAAVNTLDSLPMVSCPLCDRRCKTFCSRCRAASRPCPTPLSVAVRDVPLPPMIHRCSHPRHVPYSAQSTRWGIASTNSRTQSASSWRRRASTRSRQQMVRRPRHDQQPRRATEGRHRLATPLK